MTAFDRSKSLQQLDSQEWGEAAYDSHLVTDRGTASFWPDICFSKNTGLAPVSLACSMAVLSVANCSGVDFAISWSTCR